MPDTVLRQKDQKFINSFGHIVRLCLNKPTTKERRKENKKKCEPAVCDKTQRERARSPGVTLGHAPPHTHSKLLEKWVKAKPLKCTGRSLYPAPFVI